MKFRHIPVLPSLLQVLVSSTWVEIFLTGAETVIALKGQKAIALSLFRSSDKRFDVGKQVTHLLNNLIPIEFFIKAREFLKRACSRSLIQQLPFPVAAVDDMVE